MSNPKETQQRALKKISIKEKAAANNKRIYGISVVQGLLYTAVGVLIGVLMAEKIYESLPSILPNLMAIFVAFFLIFVVLVLILPRIFRKVIQRYTGKDLTMEEGLNEVQQKTNHLADILASTALSNANPEAKKNIRHDLPILLNFLIFARMRNVGLRYLMMAFIAIGGLMGTIVLYNQNQLLAKQNEKIDNQILLDEASRRSSLNFLLANLLDKVDAELKEAKEDGKPRRLSAQLVGRIASLSHSLQPYQYWDNGSIIEKAISPERGSLLIALLNSKIDTLTLDTIYRISNFKAANLEQINLSGAYLKGIDLSGANLAHVNLDNANLNDAVFQNANLYQASLGTNNGLRVNFKSANLTLARFDGSCFDLCSFMSAKLHCTSFRSSSLRRTYLNHADLTNSSFSDADLGSAFGLTVMNLKTCASIYKVRNLTDSLAIHFKDRIENDAKGMIRLCYKDRIYGKE